MGPGEELVFFTEAASVPLSNPGDHHPQNPHTRWEFYNELLGLCDLWWYLGFPLVTL